MVSNLLPQVAPCTYMLGTLFSNSLLLVGGMVMCFVTSWRLSMLAFTTVGPIYHITQVLLWYPRATGRRGAGETGMLVLREQTLFLAARFSSSSYIQDNPRTWLLKEM